MNSVSIIIPTYNRVHTVCETIESALRQSVTCEVVVVNHGSTDNTSSTVKKRYGSRVKYIEREVDNGPHFCWLDGVMNSSGEFVHIHFDDDLLEPQFIEKLLPMMSDDVGFAFCKARLFNEKYQDLAFAADLFQETGVYKSIWNFRRFCRQLVSPAAVLLRRSDCIDALYQGKLPYQQHSYHGVGPDLLLTLLCLARYRHFAYYDEALVAFRSHGGSITLDASFDTEKQNQLQMAYRETKKYAFEQLLLVKAKKIWSRRWK